MIVPTIEGACRGDLEHATLPVKLNQRAAARHPTQPILCAAAGVRFGAILPIRGPVQNGLVRCPKQSSARMRLQPKDVGGSDAASWPRVGLGGNSGCSTAKIFGGNFQRANRSTGRAFLSGASHWPIYVQNRKLLENSAQMARFRAKPPRARTLTGNRASVLGRPSSLRTKLRRSAASAGSRTVNE